MNKKRLLTVLGSVKPTYLFNDNFYDERAAGSVNGTATTDLKDTRVVTDTENKASVSGGVFIFSGGKAAPGWGDPGLWYNTARARVAGLTLFMRITFVDTGDLLVGFDSDKTSTNQDGLKFSGGSVTPREAGLAKAKCATYVAGNTIDFAISCLTAGYKMYDRRAGVWTLLYESSISNLNNFYPGAMNYNSTTRFECIRLAQLPVPFSTGTLSYYMQNF